MDLSPTWSASPGTFSVSAALLSDISTPTFNQDYISVPGGSSPTVQLAPNGTTVSLITRNVMVSVSTVPNTLTIRGAGGDGSTDIDWANNDGFSIIKRVGVA